MARVLTAELNAAHSSAKRSVQLAALFGSPSLTSLRAHVSFLLDASTPKRMAQPTSVHGLRHGDGPMHHPRGLYQRALAGYEKALGPDHTTTLSTVNNLAALYSDLGKLQGAEEIFQRALAGYEKALSPDHRRTQRLRERLNGLGID